MSAGGSPPLSKVYGGSTHELERAAAALSDGWYTPIVSNHQHRAVFVSGNAWLENETLEPEGDGDEQTARYHKSRVKCRSASNSGEARPQLPREQQVCSIAKEMC